MKTQTIAKQSVTIEGRPLRQALASLLRVVERRSSYPILGTVRLTVAGSALTLTATDLDIEITISLDVIDAEDDWSMCVSPKILAGIARVAGVAPVRIERVQKLTDGLKPSIDYQCRVTIGDEATYTLQTFNPESWPTMPGARGDLIERFTNGMLGTMLAKVAPYISSKETRYYLNGVCWQHRDTGLRMVATDGHRLGVCRYAPGDIDTRDDMIIPRKTVALLLALIQGQDVAIYGVVGKSGSQIEITMGRTTIRSKLIEGTFPDVDRVTPAPDTNPVKFSLPRDEALSALDRAMVFIDSRYGRAIRWFERDGKLALSVTNADQGDAVAVTPVDWPEGATDFGLNGQYIRGIVGSCIGAVTIHVKDAGAPFLVTDEDETMIRVCMPMRV